MITIRMLVLDMFGDWFGSVSLFVVTFASLLPSLELLYVLPYQVCRYEAAMAYVEQDYSSEELVVKVNKLHP